MPGYTAVMKKFDHTKSSITDDIVATYGQCPRKAYCSLFFPETRRVKAITTFINKRKIEKKVSFIANSESSYPFCSDQLSGKADIITDVTLSYEDLTFKNIHLRKINGTSSLGNFLYEPILFTTDTAIKPHDRIRAALCDTILNGIQAASTGKSTAILIDGSVQRVAISREACNTIVEDLRHWIATRPDTPPAAFNKHCPFCAFEHGCVEHEKKADSLALLSKMPIKIQKKYEAKGIFTIKQLSYLYKPRRRKRKSKQPALTHKYELQALALKSGTIYTDDLAIPPRETVELYLDIESLPERRFHYLIGVLVSTQDVDQYIPFWAETDSDEKNIWARFLDIVEQYSDAPIFHYGSYEKNAIKELGKRYNNNVESVLQRLENVNSYIFGRIYFPVYSNSLKEICCYLGFHWSEQNSSGLMAIMWRYIYETTPRRKPKHDLHLYNREDCVNLKNLKMAIIDICENASIKKVLAADSTDQFLNSTIKQIEKDFYFIQKSAHGKYEQSKITLKRAKREGPKKKKVGLEHFKEIPKSYIDKEIRIPRRRVCPLHKRPLKPTGVMADKVVVDLIKTKKGIKKTIVKYYGEKGRCPNCSHRHIPRGLKIRKSYGPGIHAWIAYQRLAMRLPFGKISQLLEDTFDIWIASGGVHTLFKSVTPQYRITENRILNSLKSGSFIHVDETQVNIQGEIQYVWVFCNATHVIFRLTPTREAHIIYDILSNYHGVVVSDFYPGYDSLSARQQKCWAHFIRDINEDLRKSPFDTELETFTKALRDLIVPIFEAVEKYGLKARHLRKFKVKVDKFYTLHVNGSNLKSDTTVKYQKRLSKYKDRLFVFLECDNIPWNNNMAERALRHIAVQRKISGSFFSSSMQDYLVLLGISQTCRFQNKQLLSFLMSGEKDIDVFRGKKDTKGWIMK